MNNYVAIERVKIKDSDYVYYLVNYNGDTLTLKGTDLLHRMQSNLIKVRNMIVKKHKSMYYLSYFPFKISRLDNCKRVDTGKNIYRQIMMLTKMYIKPLEEIPGANCKVFNLGYNLDSPVSNELYEVKFAVLHKEIVNIVTISAVTTEVGQLIFETRYNIINRITGQKEHRFNMLYDANTDMQKLVYDIIMSLGLDASVIKFY